MNEHRFTREEKNLLFGAAQQLGLEPGDFSWSESDHHYGPQVRSYVALTHRPTGYVFEFGTSANTVGKLRDSSEWSPPVENRSSSGWGERGRHFADIVAWLAVVKREHDTPDLWAAVAKEAELVTGELVNDDRPFTPAERKALGEKLTEVEAFIVKTQQLTPEQSTWVHLRFEYAAEAANRLTRKDWKLAFLGLMTTVIGGLSLQPSAIHELFGFIGRHVMPLLGAVRQLLP